MQISHISGWMFSMEKEVDEAEIASKWKTGFSDENYVDFREVTL